MSEWAMTTLGEVAVIIRGVTFGKADVSAAPGSGLIPVLRATNFDESGLLPDTELTYVPTRLASPAQRLRRGDVLVTMSTGSRVAIGKSAVVREDANSAFGGFLAAIRPHDSDYVDGRFLGLVLTSGGVRERWRELARGTSIRNLNLADMKALTIALPRPSEQRRIVDVVSAVDAQIELLVEEAARLAQAMASTALDLIPMDNLVPIGDVAQMYQPHTISKADLDPHGAYIVYGANGPIGRYGQFNHEESEVAVTCRGATCGVVNWTPKKAWITGNAMIVRPHTMSKRYAYWALKFSCDLDATVGGSAQPQITRTSLSPMRFPVANESTQRQVCDTLDAWEDAWIATSKESENCRRFRSVLLASLLNQEIEIPDTYDDLLGKVS